MRWKSLLMMAAGLAGCAQGVAGSGSPSGYEREVAGGNLHASPVAGVASGTVDLDRLFDTAPPLAPAVGALRAADFVTEVRTTSTTGGDPLTSIVARQQVDGVPVHGAYLYLAAQRGPDGHVRLVGSSYHLYHGVDVDTDPVVDRDAAEDAARTVLRAEPGAAITSSELAVWPLAGELRLVWEVTVAGSERRALIVAGRRDAGRIEVIDDRIYETTGAVDGWIAVGGAPGGHGTGQAVALPDVRVTAGSVTTHAGADGHYLIDAPAGSTIATAPAGLAAAVTNHAGSLVTASAPQAPIVDLTLGSAAASETVLAQTTAYYYVTRSWQFLAANGFDPQSLGAPLSTHVNLPDTCNAYFSPAARTINFFRAGGGCYNSAEATIVAHEYGHFVDHTFGNIGDGGLSEGWGDTLACFLTQQPVVGGDLFQSGGMIRTCDNDYAYPPGGQDEVHNLGQAWAGFAWHAREGLMASMGAEAGDAHARALILPSLISNAPDIPSAVREAFLRDDDDGDLSNHTPHWDVLLAAAQRHGLAFVVDQDLSPPAAVTDLGSIAATATSVTLRWTAPGDDGDVGTAAHYDLRWSIEPITEASFAAATPAAAPAPLPAGQSQETTVAVPPAGTIHFALRTSDELGNTSGLSNVLAVELPAAHVAYHEDVEAGLDGWEPTGLWHVTQRRAGAGAASFWYGQESTGNYDTGAANSGTLTSPIIDLAGVSGPRLTLLEYVDVESEPNYDQLRIEVFDADQPEIAVVAIKQTGHTGGFTPRMLDLEGFADRRIRIRFSFATGDQIANTTEGWFLDEIRIVGDGPPPSSGGRLLINEVLADPPSGYDTNGDGEWSVRGDEMIELLNIGTAPLELGGATVSDSIAVRVTFPPGLVIAPGQAMVVFGGAPRTIPGVVTVASTGLYLNNAGDAIYVRRPDGEILAELSYGSAGGHDQSLTREVDGDPDSPMVGHLSLANQPASPGRRWDGGSFGGGSTPPASALMINEVLADPPPGYDANGDGTWSYSSDEFVELVNLAATPLDLSGATVADTTAVRGTLPAGTVIPAGGYLVIFGGGTPNLPGIATAAIGPMQLNNDGDTVTIRSASGEVLAMIAFGSECGHDQSLVRASERDPDAPMVLHGTVSSAPASPGRRADGSPL